MRNLNCKGLRLQNSLVLAGALLILPISAYASSWSCGRNDLIREVHVERTTTDPVPCNVIYIKDTEGLESQVLWSASNDAAYCEDKAKGFVEKLRDWGWDCVEGDDPAAED